MDLIENVIIRLRRDNWKDDRLEFMFLPDYIEIYGIDHYEVSIKVIEFITQFVSCEYAVRPFIIKYGEKMLNQMARWSLHKNHKVRRLASEGSRPRLPWAMGIPELKINPGPIIPILENLKDDPSESVRRSVSNNLNDIAKDHPELVIGIARKWKGLSKETDAVIKHGCRTLLKGGHTEILQHYGLDGKNISLTAFKIISSNIKIGESLEFNLSVINRHTSTQLVRLEYAVYYKRSNGQFGKKVFKISERMYEPGERADVHRKQRFILITTRKLYPGKHRLSIIINGQEKGTKYFVLTG